MTCIVVTVLCNQPKAFASDLGEDQSTLFVCIDVMAVLAPGLGLGM